MIEILIGVICFIFVVLVIASSIIKRKKGKSCCGDCSCCPSCNHRNK